MVKKYNRIKSQQHVHLYKVQLISVHSVLYSVAFEFAYYLLHRRRPENHGGSVVTCSYSMLKVNWFESPWLRSSSSHCRCCEWVDLPFPCRFR